MNKIENYLHEFLLVFFVHRRLIKRVFLGFAVLVLILPLVLRATYDINAQVIVQSKKLSQADANTALSPDTDKFIPPSLADMETESNILRSPSLIRETINQLHEQGLYDTRPGLLGRWLLDPLKSALVDPLRSALGQTAEPARDTRLDTYTEQAIAHLKVGTLPGSNVISVSYDSHDSDEGMRFVERLLANYLKNRQDLQSNELPQGFYEQKKSQYQQRLDDLEAQRQKLLVSVHASDPKEEITFRLNAINIEEQSLNGFRDKALESQRLLDYLKTHLEAAQKAKLTDYTFPFAFSNGVDNVVYEDREIKQLGEQLTNLVVQYGNTADTYHRDSEPMTLLRDQIVRTREQFLKVVNNRIQERSSDLQSTQSVIAQKIARIGDYKARIRELQNVHSRLRQLDTEIDALHAAFFTYTQRYEESRGERQLDGELSNARVLSPPYQPTEAAFPKATQVISIGLLTGLLLAIALGYVREFFDHRFKHPTQVLEHLDLPLLMVINSTERMPLNLHKPWTLPWFWHWVRQ